MISNPNTLLIENLKMNGRCRRGLETAGISRLSRTHVREEKNNASREKSAVKLPDRLPLVPGGYAIHIGSRCYCPRFLRQANRPKSKHEAEWHHKFLKRK
jgi:DNA-binding XRE family transcriptional regulator